MTMNILLLEPYFTGSHAQWAEGYRAASRHDITVLTHQGQFWKWRLDGGFVTMAGLVRDHCDRAGRPDLILATSMLDLAGLLGLLRRDLGGIPAALYLHENQITYPETGRTRVDARHGLATWSSLLAADTVAFNSAFHHDAVFAALPGFLRSFPDLRHDELIPIAAAKSTVLPVGIDLTRLDPPAGDGDGPAMVLWNHRWDPDKDPGLFLRVVTELAAEGLEFTVALTGERFARQHQEWDPVVAAVGDRVVASGHLEPDEYREVLRRSDIVVSTARQEFFGVSVVEAMYAGAFPLLPDRLVYPERVPGQLAEHSLYRGRRDLTERLRRAINEVGETRRFAERARVEAARYDWSMVDPKYDDWLESIVA